MSKKLIKEESANVQPPKKLGVRGVDYEQIPRAALIRLLQQHGVCRL